MSRKSPKKLFYGKFCPNCGTKVNPEDKFCKDCGTNLTGTVESLKEKITPEKPQALTQPPSKPGPVWTYTVTNILGVLVGLGIILLILYSLGCANGMFPKTQDRMCQSIYQSFRSGGNTTGGEGRSGGSSGCVPTGCPATHPWYGCGSCWESSNLCHTKGTSILTDDCSVCRKCP